MHSFRPDLAIEPAREPSLFGLYDANVFCCGRVHARAGEACVELLELYANGAESEAGGHDGGRYRKVCGC
jgi:hypothetical protein